MKKLLALVLVALMLMPMTASLAATEFDVTEPITITCGMPMRISSRNT